MKNIVQKFMTYCTANYASLGYKRYNQSYVRVINDVLQSFTFKRMRSGCECTVDFGIYPLCMGFSEPVSGRYSLVRYDITASFTGLLGWHYDKNSDESVDACLEKVFHVMDSELIPLFNRADCCEKALGELIEVDRLFERNRLAVLKLEGSTDRADDFEYRVLVRTEKLYMALKIRDYDYTLRALNAHLRAANRAYSAESRRYDEAKSEEEKADSTRRLKRYEEWVASVESMISRVESRDEQYFSQLIEENEAFSREHLKKFIVSRTAFEKASGKLVEMTNSFGK